MTFRVTPSFLSNQLIYFNRSHSSKLGNLQYQASTGLRISRTSDDPAAVQKLFALKRTIASIETDELNISSAQHTLNTSVSQLRDAHELLRKAQRIAVDARQADPSSLNGLAAEVDRIAERLLQIANSTDNDRYIYGGQDDRSAPYVENTNRGFPTHVYSGSSISLTINVSTNIQVDTLYDGQSIFGSSNRQTSVFFGATGAQPGTGTDNATSRGQLHVTHLATTFAAGSGVQTGASGPTDDTIIGPAGAHSLRIVDTSGTGTSGYVQLNDGKEFAWTSADADLQVEGPLGELVHLDFTAITAGFNGNVDVTSTGQLSVDGGITQLAIDHSANQVIVDSRDGTVTNVDSSQIRSTGVEEIDYRGTSDVFAALAELASDLRNERGLTVEEFKQSIVRRDEDLERHAEQVLSVIGEQSVSLEALVSLSERNQTYQLELQSAAEDLEAADLTEVIVRLQQEQNLLQYSYAASSTVLAQNILDFLR